MGISLIEVTGVKSVVQVLVKPIDCICFIGDLLATGNWTQVCHAASTGIIIGGVDRVELLYLSNIYRKHCKNAQKIHAL